MTTYPKYKQCITEFIDIYRIEFCLWKVKTKEYHDRQLREAAYSKLIEKLKEIEPSAKRECVVKKINNMRSSYRKEIKKIKACIGTDEVYTPKLWYFQQLSFLNDQDIPKSDSNNDNDNDSDGDVSIKTEVIDTTDNILNDEIFEKDGYIIQSVRQHQTIRPPKKRKLDAGAISKDILLTVKKHFKHLAREDDRFDLCGKNVAMKLRSVSKPQMLIAEKLINEILFEAELGNLTLSHEITTQRQPNIPDLNFKQQTYYDEKFINSSSTETENLTGSSTQMQVDHTNHNSIMQVFQNHGYIKAEKSENATDSSLINLNCNDL